ncbi:hypothetical protein C8Q77DRAFT_923677 [Trametes polyzona]|nr:hypothetical protein C8Q77DRAFT_923677 [Trametes polyzona]
MHLYVLILALAAAIVPALCNSVAVSVTLPTKGTVWKVGEAQQIQWDVPALHGASPSNPIARIILGTINPNGRMKLMYETPIASGFPLLGGNVNLTVPSVPTGKNYIVCVFGSTRDISSPFTIIGDDADCGPYDSPQIPLLSPAAERRPACPS